MLDVDGFLWSTEFMAQLASFISTLLTVIFGQLFSGLFPAA